MQFKNVQNIRFSPKGNLKTIFSDISFGQLWIQTFVEKKVRNASFQGSEHLFLTSR